jgi:hypothetical protein
MGVRDGATRVARSIEPAVGRRQALDQACERLDRRGIAMWLARRVIPG